MEHGKVTSVSYEKGVVSCYVRSIRLDIEYEDVPVLRAHPGLIAVPKQGDTVTMEQLDDGTRFITNLISREEEPPDSLEEGELSIQLDKETKVHFSEGEGGGYNVDISASGAVNVNSAEKVSVDSVKDIALNSEQDIHLNSGGEVYINGTVQDGN
jgi:hypothetical protein